LPFLERSLLRGKSKEEGENIRLARLYGGLVKMGEKANNLSLEIAIQLLMGMVFGFFCANGRVQRS